MLNLATPTASCLTAPEIRSQVRPRPKVFCLEAVALEPGLTIHACCPMSLITAACQTQILTHQRGDAPMPSRGPTVEIIVCTSVLIQIQINLYTLGLLAQRHLSNEYVL